MNRHTVLLLSALAICACKSTNPPSPTALSLRALRENSSAYAGKTVTVHGYWAISQISSVMFDDACATDPGMNVVLHPTALANRRASLMLGRISNSIPITFGTPGLTIATIRVAQVEMTATAVFQPVRCEESEVSDLLDVRQPCPDEVLLIREMHSMKIVKPDCQFEGESAN